jgi:hypothetical protein
MARPRKYEDDAARADAGRSRFEAAGGALVQVRLTPEAKVALEELTARFGETKSGLVTRLLIEAVGRL